MHELLPELSKDSKLATAELSVVDLLCHRTGKAWYDALYLQSNNNMMLSKSESLRTFDYIPVIAPPRSKYMYNNHAYNVVGMLLERLSGLDYGTMMKRHLFEPMGMTRTFTRSVQDSNVAKPYNILLDKTAFEIPPCETSDDAIMFAGASVRSSLGDLLTLYGAFLSSLAQVTPATTSLDDNHYPAPGLLAQISRLLWPTERNSRDQFRSLPIKNVLPLVGTRIARDEGSLLEQSYALGWNRTQLPGKLDFAWNSQFFDPFPVLGEAYPGKLAIWHGGNMPGTTAAVCMVPETGTAVVVLQNSLGLCDAADWTCQLLLDVIFADSPMQDYVALAQESVLNGGRRMDKVEAELAAGRTEGTSPQEVQSYVGKYYNSIRNWVIEILINESGGLSARLQARPDEEYTLRHYHYGTFVWNLSYDESVRRAQYCRPAHYYKFQFESSAGDRTIDGLRWQHDPSQERGELFTKGMLPTDGRTAR